MLKVNYSQAQSDRGINTYKMKITGHADFAKGTDIVCSACSVLCYTLGQALSDIQPSIKLTYNSGDFQTEITPKNQKEQEKIHTIFNTIITGYLLLAKEYPENVQVFQ